MLTASYLYSGYSDYFSGHGCDHNDEHSEHLLYAYYGRHTTLRDIIDQLVDDGWSGLAGEELPEEVTDSDVREALLNMLSDEGRVDYEYNVLAECSANMDRLTECPDCKVELDGDTHYDCCPECGEWFDQDESPVFIVLLDYEKLKDASDCLYYDSKYGCAECSTYDDCGDREDCPDRV